MKFIKRFIAAVLVLSVLLVSVNAEELLDLYFDASLDLKTGETTLTPKEINTETDSSDLWVEVTKIAPDGTASHFYSGPFGEYDNGRWVNIDFSDKKPLMLCDWQTQNCYWVVPAEKSDEDNSAENQNASDLNSTRTENAEQALTISTTQLIEYDVTYSIVSNDSLSMDIEYNVYNGNSENDSVLLIAALYENGRLNDIKTQSLSVNALESYTDNIVLPIPNNHEDYTVKLMVLDGMSTLRPIGSAKQVADLDDYTREKYMYITANANSGFNVYMNAATVKSANTDAVHTLKYDSTKITPVDLCGFTYNKEFTAGEIANTNITIQNADLSAGKIEYKFNLESGRNTGITNLVKFKTLSDLTDEVIIYTIQ